MVSWPSCHRTNAAVILTNQTANETPASESTDSNQTCANETGTKNSWLIATGVGLALLVISFVILGAPIYDSNTDAMINMIAAGTGCVDRPDEHLLFSNFTLGLLLNQLYSWKQNIPWYGIHSMVAQVVSASVISFHLAKNRKPSVGVILVTAFFFAFILRASHLQEFTTTAMLVAMTGSILLLSALDRNRVDRSLLLSIFASVLFFGYATVIREATALMVVCLTGLTVAIKLFLAWKKRNEAGAQRLPKLTAIAVLLIVPVCVTVVGLFMSNRAYYSKDEWKGYYGLHDNFVRLFECQRSNNLDERTIHAWKSVDWSPADVRMARWWYRLDPNTYSLEKTEQANKLLPKINPDAFDGRLFKKLADSARDRTVLPSLVIVLLFFFLLEKQAFATRGAFLLLLGITCLEALILVVAKLPPRVYASLLAYPALIFLYYSSSEAVERYLNPTRKLAWIIIPALAILFAPVIKDYRNASKDGAKQSAQLQTRLQEIRKRYPNHLFVTWVDALPSNLARPFDDVHEYFDGLKLLRIGVLERSPITEARLKEFGIKDLLGETERGNVLHFSREDLNDAISQYMVEHYNKRPKFERVYNDPELSLELYRIVPESNIGRPDTDQSPSCPQLTDKDIVLFPSKTPSWWFDQIKEVGTTHDGTVFANAGKVPVLSLKQSLALPVESVDAFAIEMAVNPWIMENRRVCVQMQLNQGARQEQFYIPLLPNGKLHRYAYSLKQLNLKPGEKITHINVLPLYARPNFVGEQLTLKKFGFIRRADTNAPSAKK